jgi:signal transduction histidine kinase
MCHAEARHLNAVLHIKRRANNIEVEDDGKGMDINKNNKNKILGLIGIKGKTYVLGGNF